jgi:hypothetical protein
MADNKEGGSLACYWEGIHSSLKGRIQSLKGYLKHPASGFSVEGYFRDLLTEYLPKRYAVDTGRVVNASGETSDFIDIIIADSFQIPPLCSEPFFKVFAAEAVVAAIEITSAPKSRVPARGERSSGEKKSVPKLEHDLVKLARVRRIAKHREYNVDVPVITDKGLGLRPFQCHFDLCPRTFLITCGTEWKKAETYQAHLVEALKSAKNTESEPWVNAAFSISHGMFYFKPGAEYECLRISDNALIEFLLFVCSAVSSYPTYRIEVRRYRPTAPKQNEPTDESKKERNTGNDDNGATE